MSEKIVSELNQIDSNLSFQARARSALDAVKKVGRGAGLALLFLFPNAAAAEQAPKNESTIEMLIEAYEKERTAIQPPAQNFKEHSVRIQQHDAIADVLNRLDYVGAREFVKKHTIGPGRGVNLDLPLDHGDNEKALRCLIHNAFREAGAERELASGGDLMVILVTLARALDPSMKFYGKKENGEDRVFGDICKVVTAHKQFSWTFDTRILDKPVGLGEFEHFQRIERKIRAYVKNKTPRQALESLVAELGFDRERPPVYYHHKDMWGVWSETVGGETVRKVYGIEPVRRSGESEIHFQVRYNRYKMTPHTAQMFSGIYQEEEKRLGTKPRVVGSHICFGDLPRTVTSAARKKIEAGRTKDAARGIPRSPQHQPVPVQ